MTLWTIQPIEIYEDLIQSGAYDVDITKTMMQYFDEPYKWLIQQMCDKVGEPVDDEAAPIWAWHTYHGQRKKPDFRHARWEFGKEGDLFACIECEIPDEEVVLSDFDSWSIILLDGLLSDSENEDKRISKEYEMLSDREKEEYKHENWKRVFDITPIDNEWIRRGEDIQATFWTLKKEQIRKATFFKGAEKMQSE